MGVDHWAVQRDSRRHLISGPSGEAWSTHPDETSILALANTIVHFTGQEWDSGKQLGFFHVRYYTAAQGKFISPEPGNAGADTFRPAILECVRVRE